MKIALVTDEFYPNNGGMAHVLTTICKTFKNRNEPLYIFTNKYTNDKIFSVLEDNSFNIEIFFQILKNRRKLVLIVKSFLKIIRDKKIPRSYRLKILLYLFLKPKLFVITIKNLYNIYPYFQKIDFDLIFGGTAGKEILVLIYLLSRIFNKKVITFAHGNDFLVKTPFSLRTYYIKSLDGIILSTNQMKLLFQKIHNFDTNKLFTVNLVINRTDYYLKESKEELREFYSIPQNTFILVSVGRHVSRKKFDLVIKAVKEILKRKPNINIKYYLIGEGPLTPFLKNLTKELKLEKYIEFLGRCSEKVRNQFLKLSDVFIMVPISERSSIEGFGIVFLEANYFKVPVIGSRSGGIVDVIENERNGLLIKPNDLNDLVEKIIFLYENTEIRIAMGNYGYNRIINKYSSEHIFEKYLKIFEHLLTN